MCAIARLALRRLLGAGRATAALSLLLVAFAATVTPSAAGAQSLITGGVPDGTAHPYVAMVLRPGSSTPSCTGVLVRADNGVAVVLTDAHCLYRPGRYSGSGVRVTFASAFSSKASMIAGRFSVDPLYNARTHQHDVAVITLSTAVGISPAQLVQLNALARVRIPSYLDTVGTGTPHAGHRRTATERLTRESAEWIYLSPGSGNSCDGDSGGPDLIRGTSEVVALTNQGTCSYDQDTRLETTTGSRSFVDRAAGLRGPLPTLRYGSRGIDVKVVQHLLGVTPGGTFGSSTRAAVMSWQHGHHLRASGVMDTSTWDSLGF